MTSDSCFDTVRLQEFVVLDDRIDLSQGSLYSQQIRGEKERKLVRQWLTVKKRSG